MMTEEEDQDGWFLSHLKDEMNLHVQSFKRFAVIHP